MSEVWSPARKVPGGRIRNLKQMKPEKFDGLVFEMRGYEFEDPEAWAAVEAEAQRRKLGVRREPDAPRIPEHLICNRCEEREKMEDDYLCEPCRYGF